MKVLRTFLLLVFSGALFLVSCKDSSTSTDVVDDSEFIINPNTRPIDETNWIDSIQEIDSTNFTLTFEDSFDAAENWQEGDLLVSAIGEGLLRTVSGVTRGNGIITVTTEQATLVDYIQQGTISERISLELENVQKVTYFKEGVVLLQEPDELKAHKLYAEKAKGLPWKLDTSFSGDGSLDIFGDYLLETDLIFELDVRFPARLRYFEMSYDLKNTLAVGMKAEQNFKGSSSTDIAKVSFHPIMIVLPVLPAPIVIIPTLIVSIGVDGEILGEIYTDVRYVNEFIVGTAFQRGQGWNEILEREDSFEYNPPTMGLNAMVEAHLSAKYNMALYGVLSGYLTSTIYSLAEAGLNRDPWWELFLGLRGGIGASATVISIDLFDVNKDDLIDFRWPIGQAAADNVPIATIESIDQITSSSARVIGDVERESGASFITERGVCWSLNNNPTTSDDCNQDGDGDGTFTTTINGLNSGTQYFVRTYAINNAGIAYSSEQAFTTDSRSGEELLDELFAYWSFNEGQGTTSYDLVGNNNANLIQGAEWTNNSIIGSYAVDVKDSGSYPLQGETNNINSGIVIKEQNENLSLFETGDEDFSMNVWIYPYDIDQDYGQYLFGNYFSNAATGINDHAGWQVMIASRALRFQVQHKNASPERLYYYYDLDETYENNWHMLTVTRKGPNFTFYINGEYISEFNDESRVGNKEVFGDHLPRAWTLGFMIRNWFGTIRYRSGFRGSIDEVGIWSKQLSSEDVNQLYNFGNGISLD